MVDVIPGTKNRALREVIDGKEVFTPLVRATGPALSGKVEVSNFPERIPVSGPLNLSQFSAIVGTAEQTTVAGNPSATNLTVLALLRGLLAEMRTQTAELRKIAAALNANRTGR